MKYDAIVVGAGSAGAILATRLSEDPERSVLLLEAGPDFPDFAYLPEELKYGYGTIFGFRATVAEGGRYDWNFVAKATDKARPMAVPRGKVTGGTSAINGQVFLRGIPEDYDGWAALGNGQWGFQQVLPYLRKLETDTDFKDDFHGSNGPIVTRRFKREAWTPAQSAFYRACRSQGYADSPDHNHPDATGVGPLPFNNLNRVRLSTALAYLDQARHRPNLTIRPNCTAHRILFEGKRAVGIEVESGGEIFTLQGEQIVLSAGAIGSPHLLLLSGVGPAAHLRSLGIPVVADLPGVGQNLRDHPGLFVTWRTKKDFKQHLSESKLQVALRYTAKGSQLRNDMMLFMYGFGTDGINLAKPVGIRMLLFLDLALGSGELKLSSADPRVMPSLDYAYLQHSFDRQRLREAVHLSIKLGEHEAFRDIIEARVKPADADLASDAALDEWMMREVSTLDHVSGTCKMGPGSDSMAVVDQYGRVRGVEAVRVADASIMPDCIRANTNVTTMMIGERIADFIRQGMH